MKMGLVKTVEQIVRSMGPPRNVPYFANGLVQAVPISEDFGDTVSYNVDLTLASGACVISLTA